ncbi:hypothetical protein RHGRI_035422 [Rhododendron griersonianum]|uniref:Uncharacterized protein n=1 Tax=Rhododendron griersonianum TaxID=479676 RepID=A0AAV6I4H9_9ERIC|nr:hypothetical protein RHGRI_035422 [Rhododendron griersonianum]KAG5523616.1 hypothetical protein RHGRI_035422 [Rhododendron griersonianum]KAG5523617.1 hypothetical protein RHGRI_035422 [Rhododendron griersonianum]
MEFVLRRLIVILRKERRMRGGGTIISDFIPPSQYRRLTDRSPCNQGSEIVDFNDDEFEADFQDFKDYYYDSDDDDDFKPFAFSASESGLPHGKFTTLLISFRIPFLGLHQLWI